MIVVVCEGVRKCRKKIVMKIEFFLVSWGAKIKKSRSVDWKMHTHLLQARALMKAPPAVSKPGWSVARPLSLRRVRDGANPKLFTSWCPPSSVSLRSFWRNGPGFEIVQSLQHKNKVTFYFPWIFGQDWNMIVQVIQCSLHVYRESLLKKREIVCILSS